MPEQFDIGEEAPERDSHPLVAMDDPFDEDVQDEVADVKLERLSASARNALAAAAAQAQEMGDEFIGTDHVLLGLSLTDRCAARHLLDAYDLTAERLTESMRFIRGGHRNGSGGAEQTYSPRLLRVLIAANKVANKAMQPEIGTIHILSGLLREGEGLAVFLLESAGLSNKRADFVLEFAAREGWED